MTEIEGGGGAKADSSPQEVTRDELYAMVWQEPMLRIGERFGVSSSFLTRVCVSLGVPRPPMGHWTKIEFGLPSPQLALPAARPGDPVSWAPPGARASAARLARATVSVASHATEAQEAREVEPALVNDASADGPDACQSAPETKMSSGAGIAGPVGGTGATQPAARRVKRIPPGATHELLLKAKPHFLKDRGHESRLLRPFKRLLVDIIVSEALLDETLDLANQLFLKLSSHGHHVTIPAAGVGTHRMEVDEREAPKPVRHRSQVWVPDRPTVVYIDDVPIGLTLFEMTEDAEMVYVNGDYLPVKSLTPAQALRYRGVNHWTTTRSLASGRRCLQAYSPHFHYSWHKQWRESRPGQLVKWLPDIVKELEAVIPEMKVGITDAEAKAAEEQRKRDAEWAEYKAKERREKEAKARKEARLDLLRAIEGWDEARRIAAYFEAAQAQIGTLEEDAREQLATRLALARQLVGELDPLALLSRWSSPDERLQAEMEHNAWLYGRDR